MFKELTVTLYDLFGYFFPGCLALIALVLATWALFYPSYTVLTYGYDAFFVTALLGAAYLIGHVLQAAANKLEDATDPDRFARGSIRAHVPIPAIEKRILTAFTPFSAPEEEKKKLEVYRNICDHANAAAGLNAERDVFLYRKGLYRGVTLAFGLLVMALALVVWRAPLAIAVSASARFPVTRGVAVLWLVLCVVGGVGTWTRYVRFCGYRYEEAFLTFAASQFLKPENPATGGQATAVLGETTTLEAR